jgi:hypothetical protein
MAGSLQPTSATSTEPEVAVELDLSIIFHIIRRSANVVNRSKLVRRQGIG